MGTARGTNDVVYLMYTRSERRGAMPIRSRPIGADTVLAQQWVRGRRRTGPRPAAPRPGVAGRSPRAKQCFAHNARLTPRSLRSRHRAAGLGCAQKGAMLRCASHMWSHHTSLSAPYLAPFWAATQRSK